MTRAPAVPRLRFDDLDAALAELRRRGRRVSAPRRQVMAALFAADGPRSAEQLASGLGLDLASVYRNLDALEQLGMLQHVHLGHGPGLYALVGVGEHEYLYCERCGALRAVAPEELDAFRASLRASFGYVAQFTHHALVGSCADCAGDGREGVEAPAAPKHREHWEHDHQRVR